MKIIVLSTDTPHHIYFINRILSHYKIEAVFFETDRASFPYDTSSPYAKEEEAYEEENFFKKISSKIPASLPVQSVQNVNGAEFLRAASAYNADMALVFGCGKIMPRTISLFDKGMINVHRGIVPYYRGLDSDLWAIYHDDFANIGTTLHYVEKELDTGDIVKSGRADLAANDRIYCLRYKTTVMAADMMIEAISEIMAGSEKRTRQMRKGCYYSAMPSVLKPVCQSKFERYIDKTFNGRYAKIK